MTTPGKSSRWVVAGIAGLAAIALAAGIFLKWPGSSSPQSTAGNQTGETATTSPSMVSQLRPEFSLPDLNGIHHALKEWDGKVVAVNFWATWCGPCKEELPQFNALQKKYGPRGMQFIGVAMDNRDSVKEYLKTNVIAFPVLVDGEDIAAQLMVKYGDDQGVVPYTAFIDRHGRIAYLQYGAMDPDMARQVIESLL